MDSRKLNYILSAIIIALLIPYVINGYQIWIYGIELMSCEKQSEEYNQICIGKVFWYQGHTERIVR